MTVEIVILAMIAAFLGLRLYSVLGKRAEPGEEPLHGRFDTTRGGIGAAPPLPVPERITNAPQQHDVSHVLATMFGDHSVDRPLKEIAAADRRFDPASFLNGAQTAYRMILEAFWRADRNELALLCDASVVRGFGAAIDARQAAGQVVDNRLVRVSEARIVAASYRAHHARIAVRFVADIAAVTRDAEGHVLAGSLDDAVEVRDVWTFTRNVTSPEPDWLLDETDEG